MTGAPTAAAHDRIGDLFHLLAAKIPSKLPDDALDRQVVPRTGDHSLNPWAVPAGFLATARDAAVLVALIVRDDEVTVLLTKRTTELRHHAGQIAFPGGKIEPDDLSPAAAAIREAYEEVGLNPAAVHLVGYLDPYLTRSGFRVVPVVARIEPFDPVLNESEVVEAFEVPFDFLMDAAHHQIGYREWDGTRRAFYSIEHGERTIWGATAGILRVLYERLYC
jgi:8-oxo-dGTP pyrophosphatase MutT (NUDIX family)